MINMVLNANHSALKTFIGMIFLKIGTGIISLWGVLNIYFFSYLKNQGHQINNKTNSLIMIGAMIPSVISAFFSTKLTTKYGHKPIIRICSIIFTISPLLLNFIMNKFTVALFYLYIPIACFAISSIPVLNCIWSQFPKDLNKISGATILFFSLGTIIWNLIFTSIINPNNQTAQIDNNNQPYFKKQTTINIFKAINITCISSGLCFFIGSFLIQKKINHIQLAQESPPHNGDNIVDVIKYKQQGQYAKPQGIQNIKSQGIQNNKQSSDVSLKEKDVKDNVSKYIKDKRFLILCFISFLVPLYMIYLVLNMKILFLPIINDDHFLAFCSILVTISAVGGAFWGKIADRHGFKKTLVIIISFDIICKILGVFCTKKWNLALLYFMLGFNDKGILTLVGPGLIQMFGLQMATELIPYKGMSYVLSYIFVPFIGLIFNGILTYQSILILFIFASFGALYLSYKFNMLLTQKINKNKPFDKAIIASNLRN